MIEGEPVVPDFRNHGNWPEKELKLRSSVFSFGEGAVGDWQHSVLGQSQERRWADHQIPPTGPSCFKVYEAVFLHLVSTGESAGELLKTRTRTVPPLLW